MGTHPVVSPKEWQSARIELLAAEKEFTRARDQLSRQRRELPWEPVTKEYVFAGEDGPASLPDLFAGRHQLIVYHFMFDPDWDEGCPHCSFWADNFDGIGVHLEQRDVRLVAVSRAPLSKLTDFRTRMGWSFPWYSSAGSDFNYDYDASFTPEQRASGQARFNYRDGDPGMPDREGLSVFYRDDAGGLFHTYSAYARGIDMINGAYHLLDLVPNGRDEAGRDNPQFWVRHHDRYGT